jgi:hypothetical protein
MSITQSRESYGEKRLAQEYGTDSRTGRILDVPPNSGPVTDEERPQSLNSGDRILKSAQATG